MPTSTFSIDSLISNCNDAFPNTGTWGYFTLLKGDVATALGYTANATTNALTTATAHGLVTGSRVRMVGGTLPTPLLANTDYFAIVSSTTSLTLATTLVNAQAGTAIDLTDAGSGALTLTEQVLTAVDPLSVLVNKEISHPSWTARTVVANLGAATNVGGVAEKPLQTFSVNNTSLTAVLSYQHYLFIESAVVAAGVLGNVPSGVGFVLSSEAVVQVINPGDAPRAVFFKLRARNV
jgi:hypothetical protein